MSDIKPQTRKRRQKRQAAREPIYEAMAEEYFLTGNWPLRLNANGEQEFLKALGRLGWTRRFFDFLVGVFRWLDSTDEPPSPLYQQPKQLLAVANTIFRLALQYGEAGYRPKTAPIYIPENVSMLKRLNTYIFVGSSPEPINRYQLDFLTAGNFIVPECNLLTPLYFLKDELLSAELEAHIKANVEQALPYVTQHESLPGLWNIEDETRYRAAAFVEMMIAEGAAGLRPLTGEFVMSPFPLGVLEEINYKEFRLIFKPQGIWISMIYNKGDYSLGYWSPDFDNLAFPFGQRWGWAIRTMLACLWRDSRLSIEALRGERITREEFRPDPKHRPGKGDKIIYLPRTVYLNRVTWGEEKERAWGRQAGIVNGHIMRLQEGHKASYEAIQNAIRETGLEPPPNYTYRATYGEEREGTEKPVTRVVARGLRALYLALNKTLK